MSDNETKPAVPEQSAPIEPPKPEPVVEASEAPPDEKSLLLSRAKLMGLKVSNNIGVDKLRVKIEEHMKAMDEKLSKPQETPSLSLPVAPAAQFAPNPNVPRQMAENAEPVKETYQQTRDRLIRDKMKLVRLRITNLDPKKKNIPGEIFTLANRYIGTVRKFIPFGEATENGYHVPYCIYEMLKERRFLHIRTYKSRDGKGERVETSYVPEFALEVLPQLTEKELKELARMQAAKKGGGED